MKINRTLAQLLGSISASAAGLGNVRPPVRLDVTEESTYPEAASFDYLYNANMVHISEWKCTEGLFKLAGRVLRPHGLLFMYGPFAVDGVLEPESNVNFDFMLKCRIQHFLLIGFHSSIKAKMQVLYCSMKVRIVECCPAENGIRDSGLGTLQI